jgi:hypothetical protein
VEHPIIELVKYTLPLLAKWAWKERENILGSVPLAPIFSLNRRKGGNAGLGHWRRNPFDQNPTKFRASDVTYSAPRLIA